ncbi:MAG TPA: DinB family protein [Bryobacteraceae bacterium]|nr:DinB family protein [Bryobacteraceae bacterium]
MPFSQTLLPEFDEEMKNTRKILECVPDGKFDYQPHPKSMTLGRLATHVAEIPSWTTFTLDREVLELTPDFKPNFAANRAELLELFDKGAKEARAKIEAATDDDWQVTWSLKFNGNTVISMPRAVVMRSTVMNHMIHHRAQLGVFLRLNDVPFPGVYGPSADDPKWW